MNPQEYLTTDTRKLASFIDKEIGVDFEVTKEEDIYYNYGSIVVFELEQDEHLAIRAFLFNNNLWQGDGNE